jgi:ring-1,2-phenylacetyl-CoA epoxidase subunit PaaE
VLSKPDTSWGGRSGRLTAEMIRQIIGEEKIPVENVEVFFCGPQGMMEVAEETLDKIGIDHKRRFKESFVTVPREKEVADAAISTDFEESEVSILLDGEEYHVNVKPGEFILENALDADIDMPFSCQSGLCTTCRGKLISGKVSMEDPDGLTDDEIKEGYILTCVSHPASKEIKIEIG